MTEEEAARVLSAVEDPRTWQGVAIGQQWHSRKSRAHVGIYVSDLVIRDNQERTVKIVDGAGRPKGSLPLWQFLADYERR